jgi:hypothetical protein
MYTIEEFIKDCMELENEEVVSYELDDTHILVGIGYEDCVQIELNLGQATDEANVCDELLENCCIDREDIHEIPSAIDYLKNCI